jgi:hypothetical protein
MEIELLYTLFNGSPSRLGCVADDFKRNVGSVTAGTGIAIPRTISSAMARYTRAYAFRDDDSRLHFVKTQRNTGQGDGIYEIAFLLPAAKMITMTS